MGFKITKSKVDSLPFPESGQVFYRDSELIGFGLRVGKTTKSYYAEKRVDGKKRRCTIGIHGHITTEQARKEAQRLLGIMATGKNPNDIAKEKNLLEITLGEVFDEFLSARQKSLKKRTIADYHYIMQSYLNDWLDKPILDITKAMVVKRHTKLGDKHGGAQANIAMRGLRAIFNFAICRYDDSEGQPIIANNPVTFLSKTKTWYKVERRTSVIKAHELPQLFEAFEKLESQNTRDYLIFLLFTGLRRGEAARLRWDQVDFRDKTFCISDTKNRVPLTLPLSDYLLELLKRRYKEKLNDYVFPGNGKSGHITDPRRQIKNIGKLSGVTFMAHDLRRTFITIAESLDISAYAVKQLVNHKMGKDVTAGYIIMDVERLRKPMQQITDYILKTAGLKAKAEVVELGRIGKG